MFYSISFISVWAAGEIMNKKLLSEMTKKIASFSSSAC